MRALLMPCMPHGVNAAGHCPCHGYVLFALRDLDRPPYDVQLLVGGRLRLFNLLDKELWGLQHSNVCCTLRGKDGIDQGCWEHASQHQ
jgi:hypothetical protein